MAKSNARNQTPKNPAAVQDTKVAPPVIQTDHGSPSEPAAEKAAKGKAVAPAPPRNLLEAKLRVMAAVPYIRKRGDMKHYKFVRDTDVVAMLRGPMIENGLALCGPVAIENATHDVLSTSGGKGMARALLTMRFELRFIGTDEVEPIVVRGEGADNLDKSSNKAMSAARKYALLLGFNLTTGDDPDQFDEEGQHASTHGSQEDEDADEKRAHKGNKTETKADPPKKENPPAASNLPANGTELHERLTSYEKKLVAQRVCEAGELLTWVTQSGVKAGYTPNITEWAGAAIQHAVDATKAFEQAKRLEADARAEQARIDADEAAKKAKPATATAPATETKGDREKGLAADADEAERKRLADLAKKDQAEAAARDAVKNAAQVTQPPAAQTAPAPAAGTAPASTPEQRFDKRIAGMNVTQKRENLDAFRAMYTKDEGMTSEMKAKLETCYWENVKRVDSAKLRT